MHLSIYELPTLQSHPEALQERTIKAHPTSLTKHMSGCENAELFSKQLLFAKITLLHHVGL